MTDLDQAIRNKLDQRQQEAAARRPAFATDPELEQLGNRLDQLREIDPDQYSHPGLAADRQRVATYRVRKTKHEENKR